MEVLESFKLDGILFVAFLCRKLEPVSLGSAIW